MHESANQAMNDLKRRQKLKDIFKKWELIMESSLNEDELNTLKSCLLKIKNSFNGGENNV